MARILAMSVMAVADVRNKLSAVLDEVTRTHEVLTITRNGLPIAVVLAADVYESMVETLSLLTDPEDQARLTEAAESVQEGDLTAAPDMEAILRARLEGKRHR
jgi:antitoxin YefM